MYVLVLLLFVRLKGVLEKPELLSPSANHGKDTLCKHILCIFTIITAHTVIC